MAKRQVAKNGQKKEQNYKDEGITAISVRGFKSLAKESRIEIRPLTILAGANSSGKSSIMQPLLLMKQTLEASYDPGPLLLDGSNVRITSVGQILSKCETTRNFVVGLEVSMNSDLSELWITYKKNSKNRLEIEKVVHRKSGSGISLSPQMTHDEILKIANVEDVFQKIHSEDFQLQLRVIRNRCFLNIGFSSLDRKVVDSSGMFPFLEKFFNSVINMSSPQSSFEYSILGLLHVPGLRGNPERIYKTTAIGRNYPGTFENYVASIISHWQAEKNECLKILAQMLTTLGLTSKVSAKSVNDTQVELRVGRLLKSVRGGDIDLVSIADVGFGVSQVLPVLVALLVAEPGQLVYVEQPELHLHPKAQYAMAEILAEASQRGVKVVVETHSVLILRRVQTLVAGGELEADLVKLHWFSRSPKDGTTSIKSSDLDDNGAFGDWPEDFGDVELMAEGAYLDAVEKRSRG